MDDRLTYKAALLLLVALVAPGCSQTVWNFAKVHSGDRPVALALETDLTEGSQADALRPRRLPEAEPINLPAVQLASHEEAASQTPVDVAEALAFSESDATSQVEPAQFPQPASPLVIHGASAEDYPIDLANALRLGGASNLEVRLARSRVAEAQARYLAAQALWLPSLRFGVGYNKHDGRLQETEGNILEVSRSSLFYGGGAGLGNAPLAGGSGGPFRLAVNLSMADAAFEPLVEKQRMCAAGAASEVALNDNLLAIASAYFGLVEAHGQRANQQEALAAADNMVQQVETFEKAGLSSKTEVQRVRAEFASRERLAANADRLVTSASAELARLVRLPPQIMLSPVEDFVLPVSFFDLGLPVEGLIAEARANRPEIAQARAEYQAACWRSRQETWRPWLPNLQAGASAGSFGGGTGSNYDNDGSRSDVDLLAVWELQNVGVGNVALRREARSQLHQRELELELVRDQIAADVVAAHADVESFAHQLSIAKAAIHSAEESYRLNASRIQEGEGLPIELIQSLGALAQAQQAYTSVVANHNRAQYRLMRAVGQAVAAE